jgi:hypothetical protein
VSTLLPARRILLLCAIVLVVAQLAAPAAELMLALWREFGPSWCQVPVNRAPDLDSSILCAQIRRRPSIPGAVALLLVLAAMLAAIYPAVRWCLRPLRDLVGVIADVGPQNLGHRLRPGSGTDELAVLGRTGSPSATKPSAGSPRTPPTSCAPRSRSSAP